MKLKITYLGAPKDVQTKFGMKQKNSIKASGSEFGDNYLSFWCSSSTQGWKVGDEIEVEAVVPRDYQGKTYYDILMPKVGQALNPEVMKLLNEIANRSLKTHILIEELVNWKRIQTGEVKPKIIGTDIDYPMPESDDIDPF